MREVPHPELPAPETWACDAPEAPGVAYQTRYRRGCRACCVALLASAANEPRATFYAVSQPDVLRQVRDPVQTEEWFMHPAPSADADALR